MIRFLPISLSWQEFFYVKKKSYAQLSFNLNE